jgi:GNAT superfamily N-acetyltransferase
VIAVAAGYTRAGVSELKQMWVDKSHRGRGHGGALLTAFVRPSDVREGGLQARSHVRRLARRPLNVILCKQLDDA